MQLIATHRHDQADPLRAQTPNEEPEEVAGRGVRPLQVVHRDQERRRFGQLAKQRQQPGKHPCLGELLVVWRCQTRIAHQVRKHARQVDQGPRRKGRHGLLERRRRHVAQRRRDRSVWELASGQLDALAAEDEHPSLGGASRRLARESRLADAGLADDQDDRGTRFLDGLEGADKTFDLDLTADKLWARNSQQDHPARASLSAS